MPGKVIQVSRPAKPSASEAVYLFEIVRGLFVTMGHLFKNIVDRKRLWTVQYPEERREIPVRFRGTHRLMKRDNGTPRCVACLCCMTACPARCIEIVAMESPDPTIEKVCKSFVIDELRCVFCGMCVEACPCDAIRMDTGWFTTADDARGKLIFDRERLLDTKGAVE